MITAVNFMLLFHHNILFDVVSRYRWNYSWCCTDWYFLLSTMMFGFSRDLGVHIDGYIAVVGHTIVVGASRVSCNISITFYLMYLVWMAVGMFCLEIWFIWKARSSCSSTTWQTFSTFCNINFFVHKSDKTMDDWRAAHPQVCWLTAVSGLNSLPTVCQYSTDTNGKLRWWNNLTGGIMNCGITQK